MSTTLSTPLATRRMPDLRGAVLPLLLLAAWQIWAMTLPAVTRAPSPGRVVETFGQLVASGDLPWSLAQSLGRVAGGFTAALVLGVGLGIAMGTNRTLRAAIEPVVEAFRPVAPMAMLPIAIMWFGTGTPASVSIVGYAALFPLLLNTVHGVSQVDRKLLQAARTMGVSRLRILARVVLPAALPGILLGGRLALGVAWTAIIAAELAVGAKSGGGGSGGIGAMMFVFYAYSIDLNGIVVCMVVIGLVALTIDRLFRMAERHLVPWKV